MEREPVRISALLCLLIISFVILQSTSLFAKPARDSRCFAMTPVTFFDDTSCSAVKVRIQFRDCSTNATSSSPFEVYAHFDCHTHPPRLKYWYQQSMLFADLRKTSDSYEVVKTYAINYSKDDSGKNAGLNTPVVLPPTATAGAPAVSAMDAANSAVSDALKAQALAELSEPTHNAQPEPGPGPSPGVVGAPPLALATPGPDTSPTPPPTVGAEVALNPAASPAANAAATPAVEAAPSPAGKSLLSALSKVQIGASVNGYYSYNFNVPASTTTPESLGQPPTGANVYLLPNNYQDQLTLAMARVSVFENADPMGFHVDMGFGPLVGAIENGSDATTENLLQGYLSYKLPFKLQIDAGKFYSNFGFENVDPALNWNYSYSYLFTYLTPIWASGVRATMPIDDMIAVGVYLTNGPQKFYNVDRTRDLGGQIRISPIDSLKIVLNYENGDVGPVAYSDIRTTYEALALYTPIESLKLAADYVMSVEDSAQTGTTAQATSIVGSANWNFWDRFYLIPRYEIFTDGGVSWGTQNLGSPALPLQPGGQTINTITVGLEYRPDANFRLQAEIRQDQSNQKPFSNSSGPTGSQMAATLAAIVIY